VCLPTYPQPKRREREFKIQHSQKLVKIISKKEQMETIKIAKDIAAYAKSFGISENKLEKAIVISSLPKKGKFVGFEGVIASINGKEVKYLAMVADDGSKISVNTLQVLAHLGGKDEIKLRKVEKEGSIMNGKYTISSVKAVNPNLSGDQSKVIEKLMNKEFETEIKQGYVIPFGKNTTDTDTTLAIADTKDFYKINLV